MLKLYRAQKELDVKFAVQNFVDYMFKELKKFLLVGGPYLGVGLLLAKDHIHRNGCIRAPATITDANAHRGV